MTYLLDVNALLARGFRDHAFHRRVAEWFIGLTKEDRIAVTPITELGFVRILSRAREYGVSLDQARELLRNLKANKHWIFIPDDHGAEQLPEWVAHSRQTTDGHLAGLARAHGAILATLDEGIPDALLIPASQAGHY